MLRHMADSSLKKHALYIKIEQKITHADELYKMIAQTVGYHPFYEETILGTLFCFWRMFGNYPVEHHSFAAYLEKVGSIYQALFRGKMPILIIDGVSSLVRDNTCLLDDLAYMAKSLAESRSLTIIFGLLEVFGPCVLNSRGYNINKIRIFLPYATQHEVELYISKAVACDHPLRQEVLKVIAEENEAIYGGNFQYLDFIICQLADVKTISEITKAKLFVENKINEDIADELRKSRTLILFS